MINNKGNNMEKRLAKSKNNLKEKVVQKYGCY